MAAELAVAGVVDTGERVDFRLRCGFEYSAMHLTLERRQRLQRVAHVAHLRLCEFDVLEAPESLAGS